MLDHVEFAHVFYGSDIQLNEKAGLQPIESALINTLLNHSPPPNHIWMEGLSPGPHSLELNVFDNGDSQSLLRNPGRQNRLTHRGGPNRPNQ